MKSTLIAHSYWEKLIKPGDVVIDATLGNGYDTLFLAKLLKGDGQLIGYDIQKNAIENTLALLKKNLQKEELECITLKHASHEFFEVPFAKLIVYNLGYLPGGDKTITTHAETTLNSIKDACRILQEGGAVSVMCYVGHEEGAEEYEKLFTYFSSLPPEKFLVCHHQWINREKAPSFFWCVKKE